MSSPAKYEESGKKYDQEPEIVAEGIPTENEPPIAAGHSRFYCSKCRTVSVKICKQSACVCRKEFMLL